MPGVIINLSSVHEIIPSPHFADYAASKGQVSGTADETSSARVRNRGIRVNAIAPGAMNTPINARRSSPDPERAPQPGGSSDGVRGRPGNVAAMRLLARVDQAST